MSQETFNNRFGRYSIHKWRFCPEYLWQAKAKWADRVCRVGLNPPFITQTRQKLQDGTGSNCNTSGTVTGQKNGNAYGPGDGTDTPLTPKRWDRIWALLQTDSFWGRTALGPCLCFLMAVCLSTASLFLGSSYAQEKDTILSDSGIVYPGGYDLNTVGNIQGKVSGVVISESGPVRLH